MVKLLLALFTSYMVYKIFESEGFGKAFVFKIFMQILAYLFSGMFMIFIKFFSISVLIYLLVELFLIFITTLIEYGVSKITTSFIGFIAVCFVVEMFLAYLLNLGLSFIS